MMPMRARHILAPPALPLGLALVAATAPAQTALERVLDQIGDATQVSGILANTADSIERDPVTIGTRSETQTPVGIEGAEASDVIYFVRSRYGPTFTVTADQIGTTFSAPAGSSWSRITIGSDGTVTSVDTDGDPNDLWAFYDPSNTVPLFSVQDGNSTTTDFSEYRIFDDGNTRRITTEAAANAANYGAAGFDQVFLTEIETVSQTIVFPAAVDGSITKTASRIETAMFNIDDTIGTIGTVTARFGNMATTVLGAVNTGEIAIGANQAVDEALSSTSEAISSTVTQVGTRADQTRLAVNSALNTMGIDGSIENTFEGVNGSVAAISPDVVEIVAQGGMIEMVGLDRLLGSMETTVLGAVNTGTIVSGVNNRVAGTVAGITGNSGTNMFEE